MVEIRPGIERPDGRIQRVPRKRDNKARFTVASAIENSRERKVSSPTNLQLTVHLKRNCLVNWNARET